MQRKEKELALVAQRIRSVRKALKLKQEEFAQKLGLDQTTISKWEGAKARPTPEALIKLASMAEGVDKFFFLEHAGLPEQYLMGKPMIPEISEASTRVVQTAMKGGANCQTDLSRHYIDPELLAFAMERADAELNKQGRKLRNPYYAELVALIYDFCHKRGNRDPDMVDALFATARSVIHIVEPEAEKDSKGNVVHHKKNRSHHGHFGTQGK